MQATSRQLTTRCCIVGGGPAGMMLGFLLGRAGIETLVLEKHADFLRDFRGDTVHPSTMQIMQELGLLEAFLKRPHQRLAKLDAEFGGARYRMADMSRLKTPCPFIAFMPQWEFLDFLAEQLDAVRRRRLLPVRIIQSIQTAAQNNIIAKSLEGAASAPLPIRLVGSVPWLQGLTARVIGLGIRQEHVRTPRR